MSNMEHFGQGERQPSMTRYGFRVRTNDFLLLGVERADVVESLDLPIIQSLVGHSLLIEGLRELRPGSPRPVFRYGPFGKPYLSNIPDLFFNTSHCKDAVVSVLSEREIGVDVESLVVPECDLMETVLNAHEQTAVRKSAEPGRTFTQLWTRKESYLKWRGTGIDDQLKDVLHEDTCVYYTRSGANYEISVCMSKR